MRLVRTLDRLEGAPAAVQDELRRCKYVKSFRLGVYGEGESGVTIVEFK